MLLLKLIKEVSDNYELPVYGVLPIITVDFSQYPDIANYIPSSGTTWTESTSQFHKLIPVPAGYHKVSFTYGTKNYTYSFLKGTNNTGTIPFSSSETGRHTMSTDSGWLDIPSDATYIYLFSYSTASEINGLPKSMRMKA